MNLRRNLRIGLLFGVVFGGGYSLWICFLWVVGGEQALSQHGFGLMEGIAAYFGGGLVGGTIVGLLLPLRKWAWGAVLLGIALCVPMSIGIVAVSVSPDRLWSWSGIPLATGIGALIGGVTGWQAWSEDHEEWEEHLSSDE